MFKKINSNFYIYKLNYLIILLLTFLIPVAPIALPAVTLILMITSLLNAKKHNFRYSLLFLGLIFFLYLLDFFIFPEAYSYWSYYERKLSFLVFPIIFFFSAIKIRKHFNTILKTFLFGLVVNTVYLFLLACYRYFAFSEGLDTFFYGKYALFFHPSYLATYFNIGIWILIYLRLKRSVTSRFFYFLMVLFIFPIILLISKIGIITLILTWLFWVVGLFKRKSYKKSIFLLSSFIVFFSLVYNSDKVYGRFSEMKGIKTTQGVMKTSSTAIRKELWKTSLKLIKQKPFFGYGLPFTQEVLDAEMLEILHSSPEIQEKHLNVHNQFLQSLLSLGIFRLIIMLVILCIPVFYSFRLKFWLYISFIICISLFSATESTLERQSGIMFFTFFMTLFFSYLLSLKPLDRN